MIEFVLSKDQEELIQAKVQSAINQAVESVSINKFIGRESFRLNEAAAVIGISTDTLNKFINLGLKVSVIDGVKLITRSNINEFLKKYEI